MAIGGASISERYMKTHTLPIQSRRSPSGLAYYGTRRAHRDLFTENRVKVSQGDRGEAVRVWGVYPENVPSSKAEQFGRPAHLNVEKELNPACA